MEHQTRSQEIVSFRIVVQLLSRSDELPPPVPKFAPNHARLPFRRTSGPHLYPFIDTLVFTVRGVVLRDWLRARDVLLITTATTTNAEIGRRLGEKQYLCSKILQIRITIIEPSLPGPMSERWLRKSTIAELKATATQ